MGVSQSKGYHLGVPIIGIVAKVEVYNNGIPLFRETTILGMTRVLVVPIRIA